MGIPAWLRWTIPAAILALALGMRLAGIDKSLWIDEAGSLSQAGAADFIATARNYDHPPLYFALLRAALAFTHSYPTLRLFSIVCGLGAVWLFCFFFGPAHQLAGWCAGLLLAVSPGFVFHSQELRQYALLTLALSGALAAAWRITVAPEKKLPFAWLAASLAIAACVHLITVFYLAALVPVLGWLLRGQRTAVWVRAAAAFVPAGLLIGFFKTIFLLRTVKSQDDWWMPPINRDLLGQVFGEDTGWLALRELADGVERHLAGSGAVILVGAEAALLFVLWAAWGRKPVGAAHAFLAMALLYWALMTGYSFVVTPIVWPRTMLPGMLPFLLGLALGVSTYPTPKVRAAAIATLAALALAMMVPWLRGVAFQPVEDLRGFSLALQRSARPADRVILVNGVEIGLEPYWPEYRAHELLKVNLRDPLPQILAALRAPREQRGTGGAVLLVYRDDNYLAPRRAILEAIVRELSSTSGPAAPVWSKGSYQILRFGQAASP